jgi:hypothetical protein
VLINAEVDDAIGKPLIIEVQLLLKTFQIIKDSQHKYYEIKRATSLKDLIMTPAFQQAAACLISNQLHHFRLLQLVQTAPFLFDLLLQFHLMRTTLLTTFV